jgi:hypothetical protein
LICGASSSGHDGIDIERKCAAAFGLGVGDAILTTFYRLNVAANYDKRATLSSNDLLALALLF